MAEFPKYFYFRVYDDHGTKLMVEDASDVDVVEVVRCLDCKYYYKDEDGYEMCDNSEGYDHVTADGFCAWAKRKDGADMRGEKDG